MEIAIDERLSGITVKELLFKRMNYSANMVKKLKRDPDGILVNGCHVTVRRILLHGDLLELKSDDSESDASSNIVASDLPLDIIYEDDYITALNKPCAMPTHPSHNHYSDTLANALAYRYKVLSVPFVFRPINRLDSDTSGIVLTAKTKPAAYYLSKALSEGKFRKSYIALLHGNLYQSGKIELPIRRQFNSSMLRCTDSSMSQSAKYSLTEYTVIKNFKDGRTLVCAHPVTGRTHQLRVHFSQIGHPIYGDGLYGVTKDGSDFPRLALHAFRLEFPHPEYGMFTLDAPLRCESLYFNNSYIPPKGHERVNYDA